MVLAVKTELFHLTDRFVIDVDMICLKGKCSFWKQVTEWQLQKETDSMCMAVTLISFFTYLSNSLFPIPIPVSDVTYPDLTFSEECFHWQVFQYVVQISTRISTLRDFDHPENENSEQKGVGSESGSFYPLLLIVGLITLRPLQLENGNLGSASSSLPTVAPKNTLRGADIPPPTPSGILRAVCVHVPKLGVRSVLKGSWSHRTTGPTQSEEPLGFPLGTKPFICRDVLQTPV